MTEQRPNLLDIIIQYSNELEEYRALEMTPEQIKEMISDYHMKSAFLEEYIMLGTIDEFKSLKTKEEVNAKR